MNKELEIDPESTIREDVDPDDGEVVEAAPKRVIKANPAPSGDSDAEDAPLADKTEEATEPAKATPVADEIMKELESDPIRKSIVDRAIEERAKRLYNEKMGREGSGVSKKVRQEWKGKEKELEEVIEKGKRLDAVIAERDALKNTPKAETPAAKAPSAVADVNALIDAFVKENDLDETQLPLLAKWAELQKKLAVATDSADLDQRIEKKTREIIPQVQVDTQWEKERVEAESDSDFKSNRALRALAFQISREEKLSPKAALVAAKTELGIKPVKRVVGPRTSGKPEFSRSTTPALDAEDEPYDGTDPLDKLKKKLATRKG